MPERGMVLHGNRRSYEVLGELRRGGMGVVYLVRDGVGAVDRLAVAKVALDASHLMNERFRVEIAAIRMVDHPQVVKVIDDGEHEGRRWYAMDHVGVHNLADVLAVSDDETQDLPDLLAALDEGRAQAIGVERRRGLPLASAVHLVEGLAAAVQAAHERGVLHRDLKPANVLLRDDGSPVLCDFGVARARQMDLHLTADDEVVGTLAYIAPEQLAGAVVDERADLYALGAILHECLCGRPPPRREHRHDDLPGLRAVPPALASICRSCLDPDPGRRPVSAEAVARELAAWKRGEAGGGAAPVLPVLWRRATRSPWRRAVSVAIVAGTLALGVLVLRDRARGEVGWHETAMLAPDDRRLAVVAGEWAFVEDSALPAGAAGAHHDVLAVALAPAAGARIETEAVIGTRAQEIGVHLGGTLRWDQGYRFTLGAFENSCAVLTRGPTVLWMGPGTVQPGQRLHLALERVHAQVRIMVDGRVLAAVDDPVPACGPLAGIHSYPASAVGTPPAFARLRCRPAALPGLVQPSWPVHRLLGLGADLASDGRLAVLGQARDLALALAQQDADDTRAPRLRLLAALAEMAMDPQAQSPSGHALHALADDEAVLAADPLYQAMRLWLAPAAQRHARLRTAASHLDSDGLRRLLAWCQRTLPVYQDASLLLAGAQLLPPDDPLGHMLLARALERLRQTGDTAMVATIIKTLAQRPETWWVRAARVEQWTVEQTQRVLAGEQPGDLALPPGHAQRVQQRWLALLMAAAGGGFPAEHVPQRSTPPTILPVRRWLAATTPTAWAAALEEQAERGGRRDGSGQRLLAACWALHPPPPGTDTLRLLPQVLRPELPAAHDVLLVAALSSGQLPAGFLAQVGPDRAERLRALAAGRCGTPSPSSDDHEALLALVSAGLARRAGETALADAWLAAAAHVEGPAGTLARMHLARDDEP